MSLVLAREPQPARPHGPATRPPIFSSKARALPSCRLLVPPAPAQSPRLVLPALAQPPRVWPVLAQQQSPPHVLARPVRI